MGAKRRKKKGINGGRSQTNAAGQKWVCNTFELKRILGEVLRRVGKARKDEEGKGVGEGADNSYVRTNDEGGLDRKKLVEGR